MISKKELTELGFLHIEDYCDYIIESFLNGQFKQARELYHKLGAGQKYDFGDFLISHDVCSNWSMTELEFIYFLEV